MTAAGIFLWVVLPYVAMVLFVVGHIWRYRRDQFGWTSRSTQLLERRWLAWGSNLFHYGALAAIGGHVLGIIIPNTWTVAVGITEFQYHVLSAVAGSLAGLVCAAGLLLLLYRRGAVRRVRVTTSVSDVITFILLVLVIGLGLGETLFFNALGPEYDYRATVAIWFRGLFIFNLQPALMTSAPLIYQIHVISAWVLFAFWPFSRLVHVWSVPWQYVGRPYILYRRRYATSRR